MFKFFCVAVVFFSSCNNSNIMTNKVYNEDIKCIKVSEVFPFINNEGKLTKYDTPVVKIYYYNGITLYNLIYHYSYTENGIMHTNEDRNYFFVHKKGDAFGYSYDEHKSKFGVRLSADSMFKEQWVTANQQYPIFTQNTVTLISSVQNSDSGTLHELYSLKGKKDTAMTGTISLSFTNKIKGIDYSLCRELDSIKNMKLYKIKIINNSRYMKDYKITLDKAEQAYDLEEVPVENREEILDYFERYKNDSFKNAIK